MPVTSLTDLCTQTTKIHMSTLVIAKNPCSQLSNSSRICTPATPALYACAKRSSAGASSPVNARLAFGEPEMVVFRTCLQKRLTLSAPPLEQTHMSLLVAALLASKIRPASPECVALGARLPRSNNGRRHARCGGRYFEMIWNREHEIPFSASEKHMYTAHKNIKGEARSSAELPSTLCFYGIRKSNRAIYSPHSNLSTTTSHSTPRRFGEPRVPTLANPGEKRSSARAAPERLVLFSRVAGRASTRLLQTECSSAF